MRPLLPLILLLFTGIPSSAPSLRVILGPNPRMQATRVLLDPANPGRTMLGRLRFLGGLKLSSGDEAFGGFSSMTVDGDRFTLLSDSGNIVGFRMGRDLHPFAVTFGDLPDGPTGSQGKANRDSESMLRDSATGRIWVGFESANAIWRYAPGFARGEASVSPAPMHDWDVNGGPESMARLRDGSFVVIAETTPPAKGSKGRAALRFSGDPTARGTTNYGFVFLPPPGYDPSDMVLLPDGRLLVLVRRITLTDWFESKLLLVDPQTIAPGATLSGTEIAAFTGSVTRDNFEALAVTREAGATILWIASDDNREFVQQSLLMKFRLELPPAK